MLPRQAFHPTRNRLCLAIAVAVVAACGRATPETSAVPFETGADGSRSPRLYVTNELSGTLSVIDVVTREVLGHIPLGKRPRGIKVSPDGSTLYVALSGSPISPPGTDESTLPPPDRSADGIAVVDVRSGGLLRVIFAGTDPEQLAVSRDGSRLFVANEDAAQISVVDARSGEILARLDVGGEPEGVDIRPDGQVVYVTSEYDSEISVIDAMQPQVLTTFAVGPRPRSSGFLPDSSRAYIGAENGASISVVDARSHEVIDTIQLGDDSLRPMGIVAAPDGRHVFVTTGRGRKVVIIATATNRPIGSVEVGERPWGIAVSGDGKMVFTANGPSNDVSFTDVATRTVVDRVRVGERPWGIAYVR